MARGLPTSFSSSGSDFFGAFPATGFPSFTGSGGWNCFPQNSRGVNAEGLAGSGTPKARLTDFGNVAVRKKHCDNRKLPLCCHLGLVSLTGSPCTASISALVSRAQTSIFFADLVSSAALALFCGEPPGALPSESGTAEERRAQSKRLMACL